MNEPQRTVHPPTVVAAGDPRGKQATWTLMPAAVAPGACTQCGVLHEPEMPHDLQRLPYQYAFYAEHDRWPTWGDAMAHCTAQVRQDWTELLNARGITW